MDFDLSQIKPDRRYKLLSALVVPRPIAWITSLNENGTVNCAPYSFFNLLGNAPPVLAFGPSPRPDGKLKDTPANIKRSGEFVVNLVDRDSAPAMHASAAGFAPGQSEAEALGLELLPGKLVKVPRLALCKVHLECKYWGEVQIEQNEILFGLVLGLSAAEGIVDADTCMVQPGAFQGVGRLMGPGLYCDSAASFDLGPTPQVDELLGK